MAPAGDGGDPCAGITLEVMNDVIQPFPTFSEAFLDTLMQLTAKAAR